MQKLSRFFEAKRPHWWQRELDEPPARVAPGAHIAEAQDAVDGVVDHRSSAGAGWGVGVVAALADVLPGTITAANMERELLDDDDHLTMGSDDAQSLTSPMPAPPQTSKPVVSVAAA